MTLKVIQSLETSAQNYKIGWKLKERYKRLIINKYMNKLFELPSINRNNHVSLRQLIDTVRTNLRALEALGQPINQRDAFLIHLISSKLNFGTRHNWETESSKEDNKALLTIKELLEFLTNRSCTLELVEGTKPKQKNKPATGKKWRIK